MSNEWFPITGNIILRELKPIASAPRNSDAYSIVNALARTEPGINFTVISGEGFFTTNISKDTIEIKEE